jgi:pyruvate/2-oxoglutarate dehydrogenase complex dihydrolipoamide acyltransferase (E2) component
MTTYKIQQFPRSRIASIDVCEIGKQKHHVTGFLEFDVSESRTKIRAYNKSHTCKITFNAWLISVIACTLKSYETLSSYLIGKNKRILFDDINISLIIEKELNGNKVPIPLVIDKADTSSIESIAKRIKEAKDVKLSDKDIVLQRKNQQLEQLYYLLPGFIRRRVWKYLLKHPKLVYKKMGNVAFTSIGMMGKVNGWFVPISVHPVCFGISSIVKKPLVIDDKIEIREVLNMTILLDHDVADGAEMARFISELSKNIEKGLNL